MEPNPSREGFSLFLELFREFTQSVSDALYYSCIFIGMIVFPIYAVVLIRRGVRGRMENVLAKIARWDPWLWAAVRMGGRDLFEVDNAVHYLELLTNWRRRYRGVKFIFGLPDLEAKSIQLNRAILNVLLERIGDVQELPGEKKGKLKAVLEKLKLSEPDNRIGKILALIDQPRREQYSVAPWRNKIRDVKSWPDFLRLLSIPPHVQPGQVATHASFKLDYAIPALLLFSAAQAELRENLILLLGAVNGRHRLEFRRLVLETDFALSAGGGLIREIREALEPELKLARYGQSKAWVEYVVAFGQTPLQVLRAEAGDDYSALKKKYRRRIFETHPDRNKSPDAAEQARKVTLAWEVVEELRKRKLL
jgi:hypothetical protein